MNTKALQTKILVELTKHPHGQLKRGKLMRVTHAERFGSALWMSAYNSLLDAGYITEYGQGLKTDPIFTSLTPAHHIAEVRKQLAGRVWV